MRRLRWFYPGMQVKRYIAMIILGVVIFSTGVVFFIGRNIPREFYFYVTGFVRQGIAGTIFVVLGSYFIIHGIRRLNRRFVNLLSPGGESKLLDKMYEEAYLRRGMKIVGIGGGSGMYTLLRGLKEYSSNLTAVVTVSDDGGSSGRLREEMNMLPPGDIRQCLAALADSETEMVELFQQRFTGSGPLQNHSVGNLLLAAMTEMKGDFYQAIKELSKVLAVRGTVLPSTLDPVVLCAELADGSIVRGETNVTGSKSAVSRVFLSPAHCRALPEAVRAILEADAVIIGPGSLYTSIIPNLLVPRIRQALVESRALKIYVCNVMTQPGETDGYSASAHAAQIIKILGANSIDVILLNRAFPARLIEHYKKQNAFPVKIDKDGLRKLGITHIIEDDLIMEGEKVRHNPNRLANLIISVLKEERPSSGPALPAEIDRFINLFRA